MSRQQPGGPPPGAAQKLKAEMMARTNQPFAPTSVYVSNDYEEMAGRNQMNFPARPINPMPEADTKMQQIQDLVNAGLISEATPYFRGDELIDYYSTKQAQEELAMFDAWFENRIRKMTDVELERAKQVNPDWFARRAAVIKEAVNLELDYAMLKLNGIQSLEDLYFEYAVETGRTKLPKGPVYNPWEWNMREAGVEPGDDVYEIKTKLAKKAAQSYEAGLFSPWKSVTEKNAPFGQNVWLPVDPSGNPNTRAKGPFGVFGAWTNNLADLYGTRKLNLDNRKQLLDEDNPGKLATDRYEKQTMALTTKTYPDVWANKYTSIHANDNNPADSSGSFYTPASNPNESYRRP